MKAFSVRELKNNPSVALRAAREHPVMVLTFVSNRHSSCKRNRRQFA